MTASKLKRVLKLAGINVINARRVNGHTMAMVEGLSEDQISKLPQGTRIDDNGNDLFFVTFL